MVPFSILDWCPIPEGRTAASALANTLDLALMATGHLFDQAARVRSIEILARIRQELGSAPASDRIEA